MNIYFLISVVILSLVVNNDTYTTAQISKKLLKTQAPQSNPKVLEKKNPCYLKILYH